MSAWNSDTLIRISRKLGGNRVMECLEFPLRKDRKGNVQCLFFSSTRRSAASNSTTHLALPPEFVGKWLTEVS